MWTYVTGPFAHALVRCGANWIQRSYASSSAAALKVCIVGSGPAGMYTANRLLKALGDKVNIGVIDRLPTPFGLVRSGVAPDHQDTKNVVNGFSQDAADPRCSFLGNVHVGRHISVAELQQLFHCVVLAYGAESDRGLGIPGEHLKGVLAAREFVWWYNGHPDAADLPVDLARVESIAICGLGNVALDCARVALRPPSELATTDVAAHALQQLFNSKVKQVSILARRGPAQAACTPKELKELLQIGGISSHIEPGVLTNVSAEDQRAMKSARIKRRIHELLQQNCKAFGQDEAERQLHFHFYHQPVEVLGDDQGRVCGVKLEKTRMTKRADGSLTAEGTGQFTTLPTQLVLKSIGYKSLPVEGVPFDVRAGVIPNVSGRVSVGSNNQAPVAGVAAPCTAGLYVAGWLKRGPTGIIGTNLVDAQDTVSSIMDDLPEGVWSGRPVEGMEGLKGVLSERGRKTVDWDGWCNIDRVEVERGQPLGKPREKLVKVEEMLQACMMGHTS